MNFKARLPRCSRQNLFKLERGTAHMMNGYGAKSIEDCLILESKLSELNRVPSWLEHLASLHAIPDQTRYAMDLCLEEVLSNIVRHGYKSEGDGAIKISCHMQRDG